MQSVSRSADFVAKFIKDVTNNILKLFYYSYQAFRKSKKLEHLAMCYVFGIVSIAANYIFTNRLKESSKKVDEQEAKARNQAIRVHKNKEAICLADGEKVEGKIWATQVEELIDSQYVMATIFSLNSILTSYISYFGGVFSYILCALYIFSTIDDEENLAETVSLYTGIIMNIVYQLTSIVQKLPDLAVFLGWIKRVTELKRELDKRRLSNDSVYPPLLDNNVFSSFKNARIYSPGDDSNTIVLDNVELDFRSKTLILGSSGSGKTSIFRSAKGLAPIGSDFELQELERTMIIPQQGADILLPEASWLDQLSYPHSWEELDHCTQNDAVIVLKLIDLNAENLTSVKTDWEKYSPGEIQRILIARVLLQKPKFVLLDESVSSLDSVWKRKIFEELEKSGIIFSTISHDNDLEQFHEKVFRTE